MSSTVSKFFRSAIGVVFLSGGVAFAAVPSIKVGIVLPISGNTSAFGKDSLNGVKMAVDELNKAGEVKIELFVEDDKSSTTDAANAAKKLISVDKVNVIIGSVASSNTNAAAPIAQAAKIPLLTHASTNVNVTKTGEYISRICFIDDFQGLAMAKFAFGDLKAAKAAIITDSSQDYSIGLAQAFKDTYLKLGGKIVAEVSYSSKDQDFSSQLTKVRTAKPDVLFVPGYYNEVGNMIRQAKQLGIRAKFLGGDGWSGQELFDLGGDAIVGHYFSSHFSDDDTDPKVQDFVKKYKLLYKASPNDMGALGYDAVHVVVDAMKRNGGKADSVGLMKAINATKGYAGITGSITLDANRNANKPLVILETQRKRAGFKQRVSP
jgi:branched-chain amino acid transport system substrate-binding protein